jgi:hypothetical protein
MSKPKRGNAPTIIELRQKHGPMATYWTAVVRRGRKGPILHDNSDANRDVALAGAEAWCRRLGYKPKIVEARS